MNSAGGSNKAATVIQYLDLNFGRQRSQSLVKYQVEDIIEGVLMPFGNG